MDRVAATGFQAGADAYARARPSWPLAAVDAALEHFRVDGLVVDVAAGTGRLTEQLSRRCPQLLAVEPVDAMRRHITCADAVAGTAEHLPLADASAAAIFVAEAFHWFDQPVALTEFARVLQPGGGLAILWNRPLGERPWQPDLLALLAEHHYHPTGLTLSGPDPKDLVEWQQGLQWAAFEPLTEREFEHTQHTTRENTVALIASFSFVAALDPKTRNDLLHRVDTVLADHGMTEYEQRWRCSLYLTRKCPGRDSNPHAPKGSAF